ncbi:Hint domain-containing protein [Roseivivax sp. CAU 1753]
MPVGYLVTLGDGNLDPGDAIATTTTTFTATQSWGAGTWIYRGRDANGNIVRDQVETGQYYADAAGNIYFVPDNGLPVRVRAPEVDTAPPAPTDDGIVSGSAGDDTIDTAYSGDADGEVVDGNDAVGVALPTAAEFNWADYTDEQDLRGGVVQDTGDVSVTVTYSDVQTNENFSAETSGGGDAIYVAPGETFSTTSAGYLLANGSPDNTTVTFDFTANSGSGYEDGVENVRFRISDIDGLNDGTNNFQDIVTVRAYDVDGNEIPVTITPGSNHTLVGNTITAGLSNGSAADASGSALYEIEGPVARIEVVYDNGGTTQQAIYFSDIEFDAVPLGSNDDSIDAGGGNDVVLAGYGDDTVSGGTGNDTISGESGNDSLMGDLGDDSILGGAGDDTLQGGDGADTLDGEAGNDSIDGGLGNDILAGGDGNDTVLGGLGDDILFGDTGADSLLGGDGNDVFWDGTGDDYIDGGADADTFYTQFDTGNDTIVGGEAGTDNDQIVSFKNVDTVLDLTANGTSADSESGTLTTSVDSITFSQIESITLSSGDDSVIGSSGNDSVNTSSGADTVDGGAGDDTFDLGAFDGAVDTVVLADGDGNDNISGFEAPTDNGDGTYAGRDQVDVSNLTSDGGTTPVYTRDVTVSDDGSGNAVLTFPGGESLTLMGVAPGQVDSSAELEAMGIPLAPPETIHDAIRLTGMPGGTDLLISGTEMAPVEDTLAFNTQNAGQLTVGDTITIGGTVYAINALHDYEADLTNNNGAIEETVHGHIVELDDGAGGTLTYMLVDDSYGPKPDITQAQLLFVDPAVSPVLVSGYDDDQNVTLTSLNFNVEGTGGADIIDASYLGDPEGDRIDNADHSDGSNDDLVTAGGGDDYVASGAGDDTVFGDDGADTLDGGIGNDSLDGGIGNDSLIGGLGADTLTGGAGDDHFAVAEGDVASGGDGDDVFTLTDLGEAGSGSIVIFGGEGGETAGDTLQLGSHVAYGDITFTNTDDTAGGLSGNFTMADGTLVSFSEIENIICFTPGARILTPCGERAIETLRPGDMVVTRDHGPQPIRWLGSRTVPGQGRFAPVALGRGALNGAKRPILVSPQHRFLFTGYRAELLFGTPEVLVSAKHLINGVDIRQETQDAVTYLHLMLDAHEVLYVDGVATESFHAGDIGISAISGQSREEMFAAFPALRSNVGAYGDTARKCLKAHEARLLIEPADLHMAMAA